MDSFCPVILFHFFHNQNYNYVVQEVYVMNNKNYRIYNQNLKEKVFFCVFTYLLQNFLLLPRQKKYNLALSLSLSDFYYVLTRHTTEEV